MQEFKDHKNEGHKSPQKEHNKFPVIDLKEMEIYKLPDKVFKMIILRKLRDI